MDPAQNDSAQHVKDALAGGTLSSIHTVHRFGPLRS
jgi:hypothetical protein